MVRPLLKPRPESVIEHFTRCCFHLFVDLDEGECSEKPVPCESERLEPLGSGLCVGVANAV